MPKAPTKKRKHSIANDINIPVKKPKNSDEKKQERRLKGKERDTEFHVVKTSLVIPIAPIFSNNMRGGVEEMLDSMVMRYIPALQGVVLSHSDIRFLTKAATIQADCPFLVCKVEFNATIWSPRVGMKLVGKVNLFSPDHISLLLYRTFNVSIPRCHIPGDTWKFQYGPAENDPEFGSGANDGPGTFCQDVNGNLLDKQGDCGGKWVHHLTNGVLGGTDGFLEFTVIGLTIANEMLSLLGSIQPDPFSPEHISQTGLLRKGDHAESELEDLEVQQEVEQGGEESDEDTFKALGKMTDKAAAAAEATAKRRVEEAALVIENKSKRKAEKAEGRKRRRTKLIDHDKVAL